MLWKWPCTSHCLFQDFVPGEQMCSVQILVRQCKGGAVSAKHAPTSLQLQLHDICLHFSCQSLTYMYHLGQKCTCTKCCVLSHFDAWPILGHLCKLLMQPFCMCMISAILSDDVHAASQPFTCVTHSAPSPFSTASQLLTVCGINCKMQLLRFFIFRHDTLSPATRI